MTEFKLPPEVTLDRITVVVLKARARYVRTCKLIPTSGKIAPYEELPLYTPAQAMERAWFDHTKGNRCGAVSDFGFIFRPTADGKALLRAYRAGDTKTVHIPEELLPK